MNVTRRAFWLAGLVLAMLPLAGCSSGGECDTCTVDADCKTASAPFCSKFDDGSSRCGSGKAATQCRVR
jgi:hypothetical protein